ncbi:MAG: hypothetical protein CMM02_04280 [Rhodopirellula sp.]|jgi:hypothetical protein|nr:hypothetical protein [Rhodopirellula sp.]|tara:strand:- start:8080 stop:9246 length:1167 start_codon:yes stop_codon:yes gene_type:complete
MMQGDLFNNGDQNELNSDAADLGHPDFQSEEPETSELKSDSSFPAESNDADSAREALDSEEVLEASVEEVSSIDTAVLQVEDEFDPELVHLTSEPFINQWETLVSQTNWQKGEIIHQWRAALIDAGAPLQEYSDEAWAKHFNGTVSGQHVGRLRRVFQRFGDSYQEFDHLSWTHFQAAIDWSDAEMWLEGALQNKWSVSSMREQRWEAMGGAPSEKPDDKDVIYAELDEDIATLSLEEPPIKNDYAPGDGTIRGEYDEANAGPNYASGPDFGDGDSYGIPANNTIEAAPREMDTSILTAAGEGIRPFENLKELPSDLQNTLDEFKLAILRHKATGWQEVEAAQVTGHLYALIQMIELPSEQAVVAVNATKANEETGPEIDPEDDVAPF